MVKLSIEVGAPAAVTGGRARAACTCSVEAAELS